MSFGAGRPPLELSIDGMRLVNAGPRVLQIPRAWSFHEFLVDYGQMRLGRDWIAGNLRQSTDRHPVVEHLVRGQQGIRATGEGDGPLWKATMNAHLYAFLSFSYDLFTLEDNASVQEVLLQRIRNADNYSGARYELFAAASLLRAGFRIAFENESDNTTTHCEFCATHQTTGRCFSVEAKGRAGTASMLRTQRYHRPASIDCFRRPC
jgi:hypothetical protein